MTKTTVRVGQVGAGFIGQMHSLAFNNAGFSQRQPSIAANLVALADRSVEAREAAASRYGWSATYGDWTDVLKQDLGLFINAGPNDLHFDPTIGAAQAGIPVFCEKPLASSAGVAHELWKAVAATGVEHRCAFMHRFIPAVQYARELIASGELGEIRHFRSRFLMDMVGPDGEITWRFDRGRSGAGAIGDLGSHHIDLARFLVGEVTEVSALTQTWTVDPSNRITDVNDDSFIAIGRLANGATASFEASRVAAAHALSGEFEIDGTKGSISWKMERLNELVIRRPGGGPSTQMVTRSGDPLEGFWLPGGVQGSHPVGWNECFAHQAHDMLALAAGTSTGSVAATFEDGYRVAEIVDTIEEAAHERKMLPVVFKS
ncbi:dehydrogenase MviM [Frondihabitans sucicola]|uniref:Dehydrogenase MviM n=1 Tax=Frondihabitans sucicola TaxID=1268041 RepID=A0ABM8GM98_9MICO|nr:Gfo/Idh/MocA family oxidoreductase [Frondihabitans sucicola]BDZ49327.1 dehydrogenase MviM [Frondihabitans sucicola]